MDNQIKKRHVNIFYEKIRDKIYKQIEENGEISKKDVNNIMQSITAIYEYVKEHFKDIYRDNNEERYLIHLRETAYIILNELQNPNIEKIKIALLHDIIEDTNISFKTIEESFGVQSAICVECLSKNDIFDILGKKKTKKIKKSGILNEKGKLNEQYEKNQNIDKNIQICINDYLKAKEIRSNEYYSRFENFETLKSYIKNIIKERNIKNIKNKEIDQIVNFCFDVKYADRIHNLRTLWNTNNFEKIKRKIEETKKYFYNTSKNQNKIAYNLIIIEIEKLENHLLSCGYYQNGVCKKCDNILNCRGIGK